MPTSYVISIIDDDVLVRESTARFVRSLGYATAVYSSAEEFLQSGRVGDSNCLIVDLHMPGMTGPALQRWLIASGHRTPIIFMTAYFEEKVRDRVMHLGASGFLRKPFKNETLIECLEKALKSSDRPTESTS